MGKLPYVGDPSSVELGTYPLFVKLLQILLLNPLKTTTRLPVEELNGQEDLIIGRKGAIPIGSGSDRAISEGA